jgi:hypothetical protein
MQWLWNTFPKVEEWTMLDLFYVAAGILFFLVAWWLAIACDRL